MFDIHKGIGAIMTEIQDDIIFNAKEAAAYMRFSPGSLAVFRCKKTHDLKYFKIGRSIRYRKSECDRFLKDDLSSLWENRNEYIENAKKIPLFDILQIMGHSPVNNPSGNCGIYHP